MIHVMQIKKQLRRLKKVLCFRCFFTLANRLLTLLFFLRKHSNLFLKMNKYGYSKLIVNFQNLCAINLLITVEMMTFWEVFLWTLKYFFKIIEKENESFSKMYRVRIWKFSVDRTIHLIDFNISLASTQKEKKVNK